VTTSEKPPDGDARATRVGAIGLGNMGAPIARSIARSIPDLIVFDVRREAVESFREAGFLCAASLAEFRGCGVVAVTVNNDRQVLDVVESLAPELGAGTVIVVHSTVLPETMRAAAEIAARYDLTTVDAAVSGGAWLAERGELTLMVGGEDDPVARARFELDAIGTVNHLGGLGSGQAVKILNNLMQAASWLASCQCLEVARGMGISEGAMRGVANKSSGASWSLEHLAELDDMIQNHTLSDSLADLLNYVSKDSWSALLVARSAGLHLPLVAMIAESVPGVIESRLEYLRESAAVA
jgi:3-hydroxyisobutyrate dehydrogenase-like beta-hydroxyacid dehydrogenase